LDETREEEGGREDVRVDVIVVIVVAMEVLQSVVEVEAPTSIGLSTPPSPSVRSFPPL